MTYQDILVEQLGRVGLIRFNRPQALNALNATLNAELGHAVAAFDADAGIGCMLLTGSDKAFAAGPTSRRWPASPRSRSSWATSPAVGMRWRAPASRSLPRLRALRSGAAASSPCSAT